MLRTLPTNVGAHVLGDNDTKRHGTVSSNVTLDQNVVSFTDENSHRMANRRSNVRGIILALQFTCLFSKDWRQLTARNSDAAFTP